jgi:L-ribulokinase
MSATRGDDFVLGIDFGTDTVRAIVADTADGSLVGSGVCAYPRWSAGRYCEPRENRFRQHPLDYLEALESAVRAALAEATGAGKRVAERVRGLCADTTGSTPCLADGKGQPLALDPAFAEEPDAMFILWKDHTSVAQAERINRLARTWGGEDYTKYEGGIYSSEWFWAKVLRVAETNPAVASQAVTIVEHCDWIPAVLTGVEDHQQIKRSRCAMGHKAMWHASWGGYPPPRFFELLHPRLAALVTSLGAETHTAAEPAGRLTPEWAARLGLPAGIAVAVGAYDAHIGAVGGDIGPGTLLKIMGTSTCDIMVGPRPAKGERLVAGICGQVDGSVIPGWIGYEAGQSAFGDIFAWFRGVLAWPLRAGLARAVNTEAANSARPNDAAEFEEAILPALEAAASRVAPESSGLVALDWLNGRRTPDANQALHGAVVGLTLGTDAPALYRALVEAAAFGSRAIVERLRSQGVAIERVAAVGGVARKSPLVMQVSADVLGMPISVPASDQSCALGAAMFAATAAGLHPEVLAAQTAMRAPVERVYEPDPARKATYDRLYEKYLALGAYVEQCVQAKE